MTQSRELTLISDGARMLAEARGLLEVRTVRDIAIAAVAYARAHDLGKDAIRSAQAIVLQATRRLGEEIAAGQARGEIATPADGSAIRDLVAGNDKVPATLPELGISRDLSSKAQQLFDAPDAVDKYAASTVTPTISAALKAVKRAKNRAKVAAMPEPVAPVEKYSCIVMDPPWSPDDEGDIDQMGRAQPAYATMPIAEIAALPVGDWADPAGCHLYLWITNRSLPKGFDLLKGWGFRYVTALTWCKPSIGVGNYFRNNTEHVLFGVRGSLQLTEQNQGTWFEAPRGPLGHSSKPAEFYELVRRVSPPPRLAYFERDLRPGFVVGGAEVAA